MRESDEPNALDDENALWYKDAIIYQLHTRAYHDSSGDGIGDFQGLIQKLDYIQDLGVTAIWILPFYPSPLRDDGYDIADYTDVHPSYGTIRDVRQLVREAHRRGLKVITELVCNHTSDQHQWFQRARRAKPGSSTRDFYVWTDNPEKYSEARIIFKDFETSNWTWDPVAEAYYWHRFYHHQPDLNFDNPRVKKAIFAAMDFWLNMGVDGLRLDAIPYLFEREGTNCENLPETHQFLKELRAHIDERFEGRMLLAEANQWPEDAVAYFGDGDECHMSFHFPLMPRMFMALRMEDRFPIIDILDQTPAIPDNAQWALFLRNHDELTLEMVTDEERDYMYRVYAHDPQMRINLGIRRRLAPLLGNDRRRIELMTGLLFSLPGTPVIYYGDEIGMGDNIYLGDRNSVRTPMQWSADRNAGFSRARRQQLYSPVIVDAEYHYEAVNVEAQQNNPHSLLWWTKRLIALRKRYKAFGRGTLEFLQPENRKVLVFIRRFENEQILVLANLSRFVQAVELDLSEFEGMTPVEVFGSNEFPSIGELPYFLTLGPHSFYWFSLEPATVDGRAIPAAPMSRLRTLVARSSWEELVVGKERAVLEASLPDYLRGARWFGSKSRRIKNVSFVDSTALAYDVDRSQIAMIQVEYTEGDPERYLLPISFASDERAEELVDHYPQTVIARVNVLDSNSEGVLHDAVFEPAFASAILDAIQGRRRLRARGEIIASTSPLLRQSLIQADGNLTPAVIRSEQSNTSVVFGDQLILKLFRRSEPGINPDLEVGRFLTQHGFEHTAPVVGSLEYREKGGARATLAILHKFVPNEGDAWSYTQDALGRFFQEAATRQDVPQPAPLNTRALIAHSKDEVSPAAHDLIDTYLDDARLLGLRTAELHWLLAGGKEPPFAPEPFTALYQRSIYQSMRSHSGRIFQSLRRNVGRLPERQQAEAREVLELNDRIQQRYRGLIARKIDVQRIRIHGDYHLGQVLYTGRDFVIIDFEGEPARPVSERRMKRSALRDVAGMLRSFHYASYSAFFEAQERGVVREEDAERLEAWARFWNLWVSVHFLGAYLQHTEGAPFIPRDQDELELLLDTFTLDKAVYEVGYELNNRPDWVSIPLRGILQLMADA